MRSLVAGLEPSCRSGYVRGGCTAECTFLAPSLLAIGRLSYADRAGSLGCTIGTDCAAGHLTEASHERAGSCDGGRRTVADSGDAPGRNGLLGGPAEPQRAAGIAP